MSQATRRQFLKGSALAAGLTSLYPASLALGQSEKNNMIGVKGKQAQNLIFLVADGMCMGTLSLAHHWKLRQKGSPLHWIDAYSKGGMVRSLMDTASASSPVTDSAAAGSAWGCGRRIANGAINMDAEGRALTPLCDYAKAGGKGTGLVSTCRITHATPASFAASVKSRNEEAEILAQYLSKEIDVLLGGGREFFEGPDGVEGFTRFAAKQYRIAQNTRDLKGQSSGGRLLGIFSESHIPYKIDRENDRALAQVPGLLAMFEAALESLSRHENGFLLQVEGGRVDHAGHANDPAAILREQLEFDSCIPLAFEFQKLHPDTLVIVTTDHGTGGCNLNGIGNSYNGSGEALDAINRFSASFEALGDIFVKAGRFDADVLEQATGLRADASQSAAIQSAIDEKVAYPSGVMARQFAQELMEVTGVGWSSDAHTAECVELLAVGPGAERIPPFMANYELHGVIREALGI